MSNPLFQTCGNEFDTHDLCSRSRVNEFLHKIRVCHATRRNPPQQIRACRVSRRNPPRQIRSSRLAETYQMRLADTFRSRGTVQMVSGSCFQLAQTCKAQSAGIFRAACSCKPCFLRVFWVGEGHLAREGGSCGRAEKATHGADRLTYICSAALCRWHGGG